MVLEKGTRGGGAGALIWVEQGGSFMRTEEGCVLSIFTWSHLMGNMGCSEGAAGVGGDGGKADSGDSKAWCHRPLGVFYSMADPSSL